jgi:hypothetical protein
MDEEQNMNRLSVTVVDVLGLLIPGAILLLAIFLMPIPAEWALPLKDLLRSRTTLFSNQWVAGGLCLAVAYLFGFLIRLTSIPVMNRLTWQRWAPRLRREAEALERPLKSAIANDELFSALRDMAPSDEIDPRHYAPYFPFAKRVIRTKPELWAEAERLEAEARFTAGLLLPFAALALDGIAHGILRHWHSGILLFVAGVAGGGVSFWTFPSRRINEITYGHLLALTALLYPVKARFGEANAPPSKGDAEPLQATTSLASDRQPAES